MAWKDRHLQGIKSFVLCSRSVSLEMRQWRESVIKFLCFCTEQRTHWFTWQDLSLLLDGFLNMYYISGGYFSSYYSACEISAWSLLLVFAFMPIEIDCLTFCYPRLGRLEDFLHQWKSWRRNSRIATNTRFANSKHHHALWLFGSTVEFCFERLFYISNVWCILHCRMSSTGLSFRSQMRGL